MFLEFFITALLAANAAREFVEEETDVKLGWLVIVCWPDPEVDMDKIPVSGEAFYLKMRLEPWSLSISIQNPVSTRSTRLQHSPVPPRPIFSDRLALRSREKNRLARTPHNLIFRKNE